MPREIKDNENRVGLSPAGVKILVEDGHRVLLEKDAGKGSGFPDSIYLEQGAEIVPSSKDIFSQAELIVKVKEPLEEEYPLLQEDQLLFTYLHLAAEPQLTEVLLQKKVAAIAYETVQLPDGSLPLLTPMSEIAGRLAPQKGIHYLEKLQGGKGVLLSGVPGVAPARVVIIGGGTVGYNAARVAVKLQADVTLFDISLPRLRQLDNIFQGRVKCVMSDPLALTEALRRADLVIGAVLVPGAKTPTVLTAKMLQVMEEGTVFVDVSIDQGGCAETSRPTSHSNPVYKVEGVLHYCVTNIPGVVPRTSSQALCNATLPYIKELAAKGLRRAIDENPALAKGLNIYRGEIINEAVAASYR